MTSETQPSQPSQPPHCVTASDRIHLQQSYSERTTENAHGFRSVVNHGKRADALSCDRLQSVSFHSSVACSINPLSVRRGEDVQDDEAEDLGAKTTEIQSRISSVGGEHPSFSVRSVTHVVPR